VMYDPDPPVVLPGYEYLELLNRTGDPVCLEGWTVRINDRVYVLPQFMLTAGERVILTSPKGAKEYMDFGRVAPLSGSEYFLPNSGATLALYDMGGNLVHATRYQAPWEGPGWKMNGGWSLESPDEDMLCILAGLWEFSADRTGGTPGRKNSISREITDEDPPVFIYSGDWESGGITLTFSEPVWSLPSGTESVDLQLEEREGDGPGAVQRLAAAGPGYEPGRGNRAETDAPWRPGPGRLEPRCVLMVPGNLRPDSLLSCGPTGEQVTAFFPPGQIPDGEFRLILSDITDCAGNLLEERTIRLGSSCEPGPGSILINEVMYDPREGEPEFIELYIPGYRFFDLKDFCISAGETKAGDTTTGEGSDTVQEPVPLSAGSRLIVPGNYLVVVRNIPHLMDNYHLGPSGRWIQADLDALRNSGGTISLTDRAGNTIDLVSYHDDMHLQLIGDTRGVSLERISTERPGNDPGNWHSAASIEGYCTPGRPNSQSSRYDLPGTTDTDKQLICEPRVFSPDNDGFQDLLEIRVELGANGYVIRLRITDPTGIDVRNLASNHIAGPSVKSIWDGEMDDGRMADEGIYVVHLAAYHPVSGSTITRRVAAGLIYR